MNALILMTALLSPHDDAALRFKAIVLADEIAMAEQKAKPKKPVRNWSIFWAGDYGRPQWEVVSSVHKDASSPEEWPTKKEAQAEADKKNKHKCEAGCPCGCQDGKKCSCGKKDKDGWKLYWTAGGWKYWRWAPSSPVGVSPPSPMPSASFIPMRSFAPRMSMRGGGC